MIHMTDSSTRIIYLMDTDRCIKVMDRFIWDSFHMAKLMEKVHSYLVTAPFTREISYKILLNLS